MAPPVVTIREIAAHENQEVELRGWLYNKRSSGKLHFLQVRDGTGIIQAVVFKNDVSPELFSRRGPHRPGDVRSIVRGTVKEDARSPHRLRARGEGPRGRLRGARSTPSRPRSTASASSWSTATSGCAPRGSTPSCACGTTVDQGHPRLLRRARLHAGRRAHLHARRLRGHLARSSRSDYFDGKALPHPVRPALHGGRRRGASARSTASGRPSAPRRPRPAATSPSSGWWSPRSPSWSSRRTWTSPRTSSAIIVERVLESASRSWQGPGARRREARERADAVPAHHLQRGHRGPAEGGPPGEVGRRLRRRRGDGARQPVRPAGDRHRYPAELKAFYFKRDPRTRRLALGWTCSRPRATARSSAAASARTTSRRWRQRIDEHNLPREAFEWYLDLRKYGTRPARRLRPGHRAHGGLDLRPAPRARDDPVPAHDGADHAVAPRATPKSRRFQCRG